MDADGAEPFELSPSLDTSQVVETVKRGFALSQRVLLRPYLLLAGAALALTLLRPAGAAIQALGMDLQSQTLLWVGWAVAWLLGALVFVGTLLIGGLQVGLFRAIRESLVEGTSRVAEIGAIKVATERFGLGLASLVVFALGVGFGLVACVLPGLAFALVFGMMPFLAVSTDDGFVDAFKRAYHLFTRNLVVLLLYYAAFVVFFVVLVGLVLVVNVVLTALALWLGHLVGLPLTIASVGSWGVQVVFGLIGLPIGYAIFVTTGSLFTLIDARDRGLQLVGAEGGDGI